MQTTNWSGAREAKPPEAETRLAIGRSMKAANLPAF